eukprot:2275771-Rhodomonas_salina.1
MRSGGSKWAGNERARGGEVHVLHEAALNGPEQALPWALHTSARQQPTLLNSNADFPVATGEMQRKVVGRDMRKIAKGGKTEG